MLAIHCCDLAIPQQETLPLFPEKKPNKKIEIKNSALNLKMKLVSRYLKGKGNPKPFQKNGRIRVSAFTNFVVDLLEYHKERMVAQSLKGFHAKGVDSLFLGFFNNKDLGIDEGLFEGSFECFLRILSIDKQNKVEEEVNVHNHGFSFNSVCISEEMENWEYTPSQEGELFTKYNFKSALEKAGGNGIIFLENGKSSNLKALEPKRVRRGENYQFKESQLHKIKAPPKEMGTYIVFLEGKQCPANHEKLLYIPGIHPEAMEIDMSDYYKTLDEDSFDNHADNVLRHLQIMIEGDL